MGTKKVHILLADDDTDDCFLFREALEELHFPCEFDSVNDGEQLLNYIIGPEVLPDVLFLDLNMPRKNGMECLSEIRKNERTQSLPVVIISTSFDQDIVNTLYAGGAQFYICKPNQFEKLKTVIHKALLNIVGDTLAKTKQENFVLQS